MRVRTSTYPLLSWPDRIVSSFSVAIWDNMYICEAVDNFNHTMKAGAWGVCVSFIGVSPVAT